MNLAVGIILIFLGGVIFMLVSRNIAREKEFTFINGGISMLEAGLVITILGTYIISI